MNWFILENHDPFEGGRGVGGGELRNISLNEGVHVQKKSGIKDVPPPNLGLQKQLPRWAASDNVIWHNLTQPPPLKNPHKVSRYTMTWLWIWNFQRGAGTFSWFFMVFTALPASPPLKTHTKFPGIQWLGYEFGIFKGGQVHFHGIYSTSSVSPLKNPHKVSRYTMTWLWIWNFQRGAGTFSWYLQHFQRLPP